MSKKDDNMKQVFADMVTNCGIELGDKVKVLCKCPSYHMGWGTAWPQTMDKYIGDTLEVTYISKEWGFRAGPDCFWFPPFVLELVKKKKDIPRPRHGDVVSVLDSCSSSGSKVLRLIGQDNKASGGFYAYSESGDKMAGDVDPVSTFYESGYYTVKYNIFDK
jgi:hypothetical protein